MNNIIRKDTSIILFQDLLDLYLAHLGMNNFNVDRYSIEVNHLVEIPYFKTIPLRIKEYEPSLSPPIASLLESPSVLKMKLLPHAPIDTFPVIPNQEAQLLGALKIYKETIGWDIIDMRDNDFKILKTNFSIFGTTFEDCLQNLSKILK